MSLSPLAQRIHPPDPVTIDLSVYDLAVSSRICLARSASPPTSAVSVCGRFSLRTPASAWCEYFLPGLSPQEVNVQLDISDPSDLPPRYNIAPTQSILTIVADGSSRRPQRMRWGLVPSWANELSIGNRMINARSETAHQKPSFRQSFASARCLIPADGYYEWKKVADGKQPYLIHRPGDQLMAMAGLWASNKKVSDDGSEVLTCTILTTQSNQTTSEIHDRMPVLLDESDFDRWLDPQFRETDALRELMQSAREDWLSLRPVSRHVNNARNDGPECVAAPD